MSYLDRLRTGRYTSPSGIEFTFQFNELNRAGAKKAAVHEFPQQDEAEVQDLGNAAVRFAMELFFTGADYDQVADSFWEALAEKGPAKLLHPRWGDVQVLPLTYTQGEAFVDGMRRARFQIEFVTAGAVHYPITTENVEATLSEQFDEAQDSAAAALGEQLDPQTAAQEAGAKSSITDAIDDFAKALRGVIAKNKELETKFNRQIKEITDNIDTLILDPVSLGQSYISLLRLPAQTTGNIKGKVHGYGLALGGLASNAADVVQGAMQFFQRLALLLGISEAVLTGDLTTREEAIDVSEALRDALDTAVSGVETIEGNVSGYSAPQDALAQARQIVSAASALMLEISFGLKTVRYLTLEGDRTPLDLVYELYGDLNHLEEFESQNRLQGDDILLLPRGREVAYYA